MATEAFEELVEDFEFLEEWEDRYRHVIDLGKAMDPLAEELRVPATKVDGCASQVWLHAQFDDGVLHFDGASDAMIVSGLIAVLRKLYNGLPAREVGQIDARAEMGRLGLNEHLSAQRSNGLTAMIERIRENAANSTGALGAMVVPVEFIWQNESYRVLSVFSRSPYPVKRRSKVRPKVAAQAFAFSVRSGSSVWA